MNYAKTIALGFLAITTPLATQAEMVEHKYVKEVSVTWGSYYTGTTVTELGDGRCKGVRATDLGLKSIADPELGYVVELPQIKHEERTGPCHSIRSEFQ